MQPTPAPTPEETAAAPGAPEKLGWRRRLLFTAMTVVLCAVIIAVAGEAIVRLAVPKETFWPVSNIYRPSDVPGAVYTFTPEFDGTAFGVSLQTNSLGFRGPEWPVQKRAGTFRIALLGDSHAFGFGVSFEHTTGEVLAEILERRFDRPAEVLNFGVNGYNSGQQRAVLEHLALSYAPDLIVLVPANNDHDPALQADDDGWLHWDGVGENEKSRIVDKSIERVKVESVSWWVQKSRLVLYLKLMQKRRQFQAEAQARRAAQPQAPAANWMEAVGPGPISERLAEPVYQPLKDMLALAQAQRIPVIVACFCASPDYRRMLRRFERDDGVPVLELLALFPEARSWEEVTAQFGLGWDNHLNAVAHRRWAEALADLVETHGYHPDARQNE